MSKTAYKWLPTIETDACMGCGLCEKACPSGSLEMVWDFATLTRPDQCSSCDECARVCPHGVIRMDWTWATGSPVVGKWRETPPAAAGGQRHWLRDLLPVFGLGKDATETATEPSP